MALTEKLGNIADAIRAKTGKTAKLTIEQMPNEIAGISSGTANPTLQEKAITANGEYTADSGYDGLSKVTVDVPVPDGYVIPTGTKSITANGTHSVSGYANAEVNVPNVIPDGYIQPSGTKAITENGIHDVSGYASAAVNVESPAPILQQKTITENGEYTADSGYDGLSKVTVNVPGEVVEEYDGTVVVGVPITFTIDGTEYQAEEGMTWEEWCISEYNTIGVGIDGGYHIEDSSGMALYVSSPDYTGFPLPYDEITDTFEQYGGYSWTKDPCDNVDWID